MSKTSPAHLDHDVVRDLRDNRIARLDLPCETKAHSLLSAVTCFLACDIATKQSVTRSTSFISSVLWLADANLGDDGVRELARLLEDNTSVTTIDIHGPFLRMPLLTLGVGF